jgi:predicted polyphosphate/ATP-dependent NAD kinase
VDTGVTVGLIANPVSARDIRRVIANASTLQVADRSNIVLRVLAALGACGVGRVLAMPDRKGIRALLERGIERERRVGHRLPRVEFLNMSVTTTVRDSCEAAAAMAAAEVAAIVVLGGDGTHRAVVRSCQGVPVAGISTGTNNAYPEMREPTITGLATGLFATGRLSADDVLVGNKLLEVSVNDGATVDIALVDVVVSSERFVGARALWHTDAMRDLYVSFAEPGAIGMSAVAGLLAPVGRTEPEGRHLVLCEPAGNGACPAATVVAAPIAPGMVVPVGVSRWEPLHPGRPVAVSHSGGVLALDGERELELRPGDRVTITLRTNAFPSIDVAGCMHLAASRGLFREVPAGDLVHAYT